MILNHKQAIAMLVEDAPEIGFNPYTIRNLHGLLSDNLLSNPAESGRLRRGIVGIGGSVLQPLIEPQLIEECFEQLLATADAIRNPFEQAFFVMVQLPYLQPFVDVNKRVSRLATNIPLIRLNFCPLSFVDVPERDYVDGLLAVYELNRIEILREVFVWAYERSCQRYGAVLQSLGEPDPFRLRYRQQIKDSIRDVIRQPMDRPTAHHFLTNQSQRLPESDRERWMEVTRQELEALHEGNFSRYRVRPSEFDRWRAQWH